MRPWVERLGRNQPEADVVNQKTCSRQLMALKRAPSSSRAGQGPADADRHALRSRWRAPKRTPTGGLRGRSYDEWLRPRRQSPDARPDGRPGSALRARQEGPERHSPETGANRSASAAKPEPSRETAASCSSSPDNPTTIKARSPAGEGSSAIRFRSTGPDSQTERHDRRDDPSPLQLQEGLLLRKSCLMEKTRGVMKSSSCTSLVFIRIPLRQSPP